MSRTHFRITLFLTAALAAAANVPRAHAAPSVASPAPDSATERLRLRAELDRVNAEIDALKRAGHGVADDYRLRARLADAEALARRLVDLERRMGLTAAPSQPRALPTASAGDGPAELEAKADILTDQSRRVRAAADALDVRVAELKSRQDLRRRAAELDRDPFAPLEQSKRRTVSIAAGPDAMHSISQPVPGNGDRAGSSPTTGPVTVTGSSSAPGPQTPSLGLTGAPTGTPTPVAVAPLTASVELRDLLDPATAADLGRLDRGRAPSSLAALQRAVAALRESGADVRGLADILSENARQLRDLRAAIMRARM
ncbi:MAG TPA: hypothetical protein VLT58_05100, partial [Polyangia bacterium]|nr:hypothetical protein [Polyangia bacterium]